jgi:hypothetical protein
VAARSLKLRSAYPQVVGLNPLVHPFSGVQHSEAQVGGDGAMSLSHQFAREVPGARGDIENDALVR